MKKTSKNITIAENAEAALAEKRKKTRRRKTVKKIIIWTIIFVALIFGLYVYNFKLKNDRWPWQEEVVTSEIDSMVKTKAYTSTYTSEIDVSGYVEAFQTQTVVIRSSGAVTGVYVKEGDRVKEGQLLATIDSTSQEYNVAQIEWDIEKAKINGTSSAKDMELKELNLKTAKQQLENTKAYANFDGVVISVEIQEGAYFNAGSTVMTIIDDSKLKASVEIDEIDIQMVREGMKTYLTSDSTPDSKIEARVSYIPMIGRYSSQGIGVMDVEIVIDNPPAALKPGFSFEGTIEAESSQEMLLVSQNAITTVRGKSTVTKLLDNGETQTVDVVAKYVGENLYQIISGDVKDGDTLVYSRNSGFAGFGGGMSMGGGFR